MQDTQLNRISNFLWSVSDDLLRDLYVRGKYRDVILPMTVLRRLDAVLEPTKQKVLKEKQFLDDNGITEQDGVLQQEAGHAFYNTSQFTMRDLAARAAQQSLRADFEAYLDGYSANVQEILDCFEFRNQINRLSQSDVLGALITRFLSPDINLSPYPVKNDDGSVKLPSLDNHAMGTIFEDLVRRFNEENNEEAGEHWTPRDAVELMAQLVFQPIAEQIQSGTYLLYDGAIGTGGMLTIAEKTLHDIATLREQQVSTHLYGQEINSETYAICKADLLLRGEKDADANIVGGPQHSTLSNDAFGNHTFDFMLSNPPYGKSWKTDLDRMGGKSGMTDHRFVIQHDDDPELSLITRVNDGQLMFLANMLSKMKHNTPLGSRIAEVHNGSSLFTGDAGQGESNIRRWIIENDWLEAIVALPLNMFYNTGIATYVWVLTNRKAEQRQGHVQLIDATKWFTATPEPRPEELRAVGSRHRPHHRRIHGVRGNRAVQDIPQRRLRLLESHRRTPYAIAGTEPEKVYKASEIQKLRKEGQRDENASPIIKRVHTAGSIPDPLHGLFPPPSRASLRSSSTNQTSTSGILSRYRCSKTAASTRSCGVRSCPTPHTWYTPASVKVGYEISFNRHFYKPQPMRSLDEITADIIALERRKRGIICRVSKIATQLGEANVPRIGQSLPLFRVPDHHRVHQRVQRTNGRPRHRVLGNDQPLATSLGHQPPRRRSRVRRLEEPRLPIEAPSSIRQV